VIYFLFSTFDEYMGFIAEKAFDGSEETISD